MPGTLIVDAENVRRSLWPNLSRAGLVRLCGLYAQADDRDVTVVFDGSAPAVETPVRVVLVASEGRGADDVIAELGRAYAPPVAVATSDRALRERLPAGVAVLGGGAFARALVAAER